MKNWKRMTSFGKQSKNFRQWIEISLICLSLRTFLKLIYQIHGKLSFAVTILETLHEWVNCNILHFAHRILFVSFSGGPRWDPSGGWSTQWAASGWPQTSTGPGPSRWRSGRRVWSMRNLFSIKWMYSNVIIVGVSINVRAWPYRL